MDKNKIIAVLGPTNTGKTHLAIETMLSFENGMIGFPLRLLAREVYDKVVQKTSLDKVALITGEEKIIPNNAKYFLCTVESMPIDKHLDFVGVDEKMLREMMIRIRESELMLGSKNRNLWFDEQKMKIFKKKTTFTIILIFIYYCIM